MDRIGGVATGATNCVPYVSCTEVAVHRDTTQHADCVAGTMGHWCRHIQSGSHSLAPVVRTVTACISTISTNTALFCPNWNVSGSTHRRTLGVIRAMPSRKPGSGISSHSQTGNCIGLLPPPPQNSITQRNMGPRKSSSGSGLG